MGGVSRITRFGFVNAYLVTEEDGYTLVDTLVPRSAKRILETAARTGRPIRRIVLGGRSTHFCPTCQKRR